MLSGGLVTRPTLVPVHLSQSQPLMISGWCQRPHPVDSYVLNHNFCPDVTSGSGLEQCLLILLSVCGSEFSPTAVVFRGSGGRGGGHFSPGQTGEEDWLCGCHGAGQSDSCPSRTIRSSTGAGAPIPIVDLFHSLGMVSVY